MQLPRLQLLALSSIEAAGNGRVDLDDDRCQQRFDRNIRDSGAIIVGAGHAETRERLSFSSYGQRVDLQGWGHRVTTTGYGGLFDPSDIRQRYTSSFNGTSSASPIVAWCRSRHSGSLDEEGACAT